MARELLSFALYLLSMMSASPCSCSQAFVSLAVTPYMVLGLCAILTSMSYPTMLVHEQRVDTGKACV